MKRCILTVPALGIGILVCGGIAVAQELKGTTKAIAIVDNFEDGDLAGWSGPTGPCTAVNTALTGADGTSRSLQIDGNCGPYGGVWIHPAISEATNVSFWVRRSSASNIWDNNVVIGDDNITSNHGAVYFSAPAFDEFAVRTSTADYKLGPNLGDQWYLIHISLDWIGKTIDVDIDGIPRQRNVPFRAPGTTALTQLHFFSLSDFSVGWLDEIYSSSPPPSLAIFDDGFESADTTAWSHTVPTQPTRLVLYDGGSVSGAIGGRSGADVLCGIAAESATGIPAHATTRAFLSFSVSDEIRDMSAVHGVPTDRPVTGPNWNVIATDWADLLDGSISMSLQDAGVQTATNFWFSGSNFDGSLAPENCSGWTDGAAFLDGRYGRTFATDSAWIATGAATCGSSSYHVLCLAWR